MESPIGPDYQHQELTGRILGCFYDVYNELGFGFLESVYEQALKRALVANGLNVESSVRLEVYFRGEQLCVFEADLVVEHVVILELKATERLCPEHEAQLLNYLRATSIEIGFLMNFGPKPVFKRMAFSNTRKQSRPAVDVISD